MVVKPAIKRGFRHRTVEHVDHFTLFENHNRRDAANAKTGAQFRFSFSIDLNETYFPAAFFGS